MLACSACVPEPAVEQRQLAVFGTLVTLTTYGVKATTTDTATTALERRFLELAQDWYPWADGELARVNAALAQRQPIEVSPALAALLRRAAELERQSDGNFNAGLGALTELWGFHRPEQQHWQPPDAARIAAALAGRPGAAQLQWSGATVTSATAFQLDLGGVAKGAILEIARRELDAQGIHDAIIDIGGDLLVIGDAGGRPARIGIRQPGSMDALGWVAVAGGEAVMTSGNYERFFEFEGRRYAHILDPATGYPAAGVASVTVLHTDPLLADAAATALLVAGSDGFAALCEKLDLDYALLLTTSGDLRLTGALQERVNWVADGVSQRSSVSQ